MVLGLRTISDSAANNAMTHRLGVGRMRHLDVKVLWLQQMVYQGLLTMTWQSGKYNNSDLGTKVLGKARFLELVEMCGLKPLKGGISQVCEAVSAPTTLTATRAAQILTTMTWLSQVARARSDPGESRPDGGDYILLGLLLAALTAGWMLCWIWSRYQCSRNQAKEPETLVFYKTGSGTVLHCDRSCGHLKVAKRLETWTVCKDCDRKNR